MKDLERIQGAPSYLLLMLLLVKRKNLGLSNAHLATIVRLLVTFFVRRNLTDTPPTRDLTKLFMVTCDKVLNLSGEAVVALIRESLSAVSATDENFRSKLEGPMYTENIGVTRFVLCALAEHGMTRETWVDLWKFENNQFVWTIEHIFPKGVNIPDVWVTMMAAGDVIKAKEYLQTHAHKLGNLTVSGFNSALGNKSFEEKRDRVDRQNRAVGYRNGLSLNATLATAKTWDAAQIDNRTITLVDQIQKLFTIHSK
jgi:hypothetical protein